MAVKDLHHRITADASGFRRGMSEAEKSARALERALAQEEARQARVDAAMQRTGRFLLGMSAAIAAGLAVSARAAIRWESAWAGVAKTLSDVTEPQLAALEEDLRALARELPQSHEEIAAVAAAAGQLGVATEDIVEFTRTMVDLGVATNLTSEEAAFAIARMTNIMQTAPEDVRRLASALVDLGNSSATTESEILEMALRIAGAGQTIGLSEQQVLGFAAALSSVGIRAQAGGTAISRVFLEIDSAVSQSGDNLDAFAEVAGVSAEQFAEAYRRDAGQAIAAFISGLGRVQRTGGDVNQVLDRLGLTEIRVSDALRRTAGAGDLLNKTLGIANEAWDENEALTAEAERRYGTMEARLAIARNQLNDFGISIGQNVLPVLGDMVDKAGALLSVLGELPAPVRTAITVVAALGAAITLAGGVALIAVPRIAGFRAELDRIENSTGRAAGAVRGFRRVLGGIPWGPVGVAAGVLTVAIGVFAAKQAEARQRVEEVSETLDQQTGALTDNTRAWVAHKLEQDGVLERAEQLGLDLATVTDAVMGDSEATAELNRVLGENSTTTIDAARAAEEYRQRLLGQGVDAGEAALQATRYRMELEAQARASRETGGAVDQLRSDIEKAQGATRRQAEATGEAAGQTERLTPQMEHLAEVFGVGAGEAEGLNDELKEMDERLRTLFDSAFAVDEAQDAVTEGMRRLIEHAKEEGGVLEGNSEAALRNRDNLRDLIREHGDYISELVKSGASQETVRQENEDFIRSLEEQAEQVGINRDELDPYIEVLEAIPDTVATSVELDTAAANAALERFNAKLRALPGFGGAEVHHSGGLVGFGAFTRPRHDEVPAILQRGEFVSTRAATQQNRAALEAANAGARLAVVGAGGTSGGTAVPAEFVAHAVIDLGEGIERRVEMTFRRHDAALLSRLTAGAGAAR